MGFKPSVLAFYTRVIPSPNSRYHLSEISANTENDVKSPQSQADSRPNALRKGIADNAEIVDSAVKGDASMSSFTALWIGRFDDLKCV